MKPGKRIDARRQRVINSRQEGLNNCADTFGELRYQYGQDSSGIFAGLGVTVPSVELSSKLRSRKMVPYYSVTYETLSPGSTADADYDDAGFVCVDMPIIANEWETQAAAERGVDPIVAVCLQLCEERNATEWSSSDPMPGDFIATEDLEVDHDTGDLVTYALHFSGLTNSQWAQLVKLTREQF